MKRGKDDENIMGPMFPRLHVNDTEKGGPRAPPRNKMALYEQLSIPSQRFNPGVRPLNRPNNSSSLVLPKSSSQVIVRI
jgi:EARLY FLOWERING 3 protein